ncbi:MAG TPA: hypothetical protein PKU91_09445, partial [Phycisphaerales bacterium]|nr:hypothetical protein [Phycisphaerales bacterium]
MAVRSTSMPSIGRPPRRRISTSTSVVMGAGTVASGTGAASGGWGSGVSACAGGAGFGSVAGDPGVSGEGCASAQQDANPSKSQQRVMTSVRMLMVASQPWRERHAPHPLGL